MQLPLSLSLRPSRRLFLLLTLAHGAAAAALAALGLDPWIGVPMLLGVILSLAWQLRRLFGAQRIVELILHKDGALEYVRRDGTAASGKVDPQTMVTAWLTVLLLRSGAGRRCEALTLLPDTLESEDFRRLRLWLRWLAAERGGRGER